MPAVTALPPISHPPCSPARPPAGHLGTSASHGATAAPRALASRGSRRFIQLPSFYLRHPHSMERQGFKLTTCFPPPQAPQASPKGCPCMMRLFLPGLLCQPLISRCWLTVAARGPITKAHCRAACGRLGSSGAHAHWYQQLPEA